MRTRVVAQLSILSSFILGYTTEAIAQGGPRQSPSAEHWVTVVVPVIVSLIPPDPAAPHHGWRVRTNDPNLRRRLQGGGPVIRGVGDTLQITITPP